MTVWQWTPYAVLSMVVGIMLILAAVYVWRNPATAAVPFLGGLILFVASVWVLFSGLEYASADFPTAVFWNRLAYLGVVATPFLWALYVFRYTGYERWLAPDRLFLLVIIPVITLILVFTNESHHLMWRINLPANGGPSGIIEKAFGPGFWLFVSFAYLLVFAAAISLVRMLTHSHQIYRWQVIALFFAALLPLLASIVDIFPFGPFATFDPTPMAFAICGLIVVWTLPQFFKGDIVPVARDAVIEGMRDAVVVLDRQDLVVDMNPAARQLFIGNGQEPKGMAIQHIWPEWPQDLTNRSDERMESFETSFGLGREAQSFDVKVSPMHDWQGRLVSWVLVLRDITERKRRTEQMTSLVEASTVVSSTLELDRVLASLADHMIDIIGVSGCTLSRWDREDDKMVTLIERRRKVGGPIDKAGTTYDLSHFPARRTVLVTRLPQVVQVSDPDADPAEVELMRKQGARSLLMLPLVVGKRTLGLVELDESEYERDFQLLEIEICQALADQAAIAIESAHIHVQLRRQLKEQIALREAGAAVVSSLELRHVLRAVTVQLINLLGVDGCTISDWRRADNTLSVIEESSPEYWQDKQASQAVYDLELYHVTKRVLEKKRAVQMTVSQPGLDPAQRAIMQKTGIQSLLMLPMVFKDSTLGLIELSDSKAERAFPERQIELAQLLANQAAGAIQNARLFQQLRQRLKEQIALREAAVAISSNLSLQDVLTSIAAQMSIVVGATSVHICGYDPEKKTALVLADHISDDACEAEQVSYLGVKYQEESAGEFGYLAEVLAGISVAIHREDLELSSSLQNHMLEYGARSILYVPLKSKGHILGFVELWESRKSREFTRSERSLCEDLAHHAAIALENAQLYEQSREEIAERKKAEAELKAERALLAERVAEQTAELRLTNEQLAQAARLKDDFLASMSHELRTPLNAILGISEGLQEDLYGPLNEGQRRPITLVEQSGRHLLELINDILDVSKIESGQLALKIEAVTVKTICEESLRFVEESAYKKHIAIDSRVDNHVQNIQADSLRLKQMLINLLSNAVKFTPEHGTIGLEVQGEPAKKMVRFSVWDTGIGISEEDIPHLFEPFTQLDSKLSRHYTGTGLGLTLVKRMTEMHKGTVSVESVVGKGSRFTITLPWRLNGQEKLQRTETLIGSGM